MDIKPILFYAAEGTASDFEYQVKQIEKREIQRLKNGLVNENEKFDELWDTKDEKGRNALFHATITDNLKNFLYILKKRKIQKEDFISIVDYNKANILHWATQYNCIKIVKEITQAFEKTECVVEKRLLHDLIIAKDSESVTPLHIAATKLDTKILRMFVEALRTYENISNLYQIVQDKRQRSPLHYAACKANLEAIRLLLDPNPNLGFVVDQRDKSGTIPLMCAVGVNLPQALPVIRLLEKKKPVSKTRQNRDGMTALHIAVAARNLDAVKLLIELECSYELVDNEQRTPLHYAAEHGYPEIVKYLFSKGARNSTRDIIGATPAHYAAQFSVECLKTIFEESNINEVNDNENRSCLMWAVCSGNVDVINYLIQREDAPKRAACDKHGYTALHLAAMVGNEKVCKILTNQGWSLSERDNHSNTALHLASGRGHTDVLRCLVSSGANMNDVDEIGRTPIFWACMGGQSHTLHCMIKELSFEWRTPGLDTRPVCDNFGRTALHAAANAGSSACINVLLNIEQEDNSLSSPLVGWLDHNGETALHEACLAGKFDCVLSLLKGGSGINAIGRPQRTPLDCAMNPTNGSPNKIIVDHLRSENALTYSELSCAAASLIQWRWRQFLPKLPKLREERERQKQRQRE
ncbi:CBN-MLT-4 protein [Caenorhabditis brenneri]|uniref:CBN-MLT-4 protein n=1 Tax=Caenorhabditis brenneri TaxID=135651 RepID=G0N0X3_CAEBE|nr:CBN-MLT-4 protein [Caenorhabditis brenneri]